MGCSPHNLSKKCVCSCVIAFLHQGSLTLAGLPLGSRKLFIEEGCTFQGFVELANSILRQPRMYLATDSWLLRRELLLPLLMAEKLRFIFFLIACVTRASSATQVLLSI